MDTRKITAVSKFTVGHFNPEAVFQDPQHRIKITDAALQHIRREIQKRQRGIGLRFGVKKSGCSGWMYDVAIIDTPIENSLVFTASEDLKIYVDKKSFDMVKGTTIDHQKKGINSILVYNNPNVGENCGCGESFTIETQTPTEYE